MIYWILLMVLCLLPANTAGVCGGGNNTTDMSRFPKWRGFAIMHHPTYGYLLLQKTRKGGGVGFQLPGGHVDQEDADVFAAHEKNNGASGLPHAVGVARIATAREVFEETGYDYRNALERFSYLFTTDELRHFFLLEMREDDVSTHLSGGGVKRPGVDFRPFDGQNGGKPFPIILSEEHTGFLLEKDLEHAAILTEKHSGGNVSTALKLYAKSLKSNTLPTI